MMRFMIVGLVLLAASAALAQDAAWSDRLAAMNEAVPAPDRRTLEAGALAALRADAQRKGECVPTGVKLDKPTPGTADRVILQAILAGKLRNGWLNYGEPRGCSAVARARFIVLRMPDESLVIRVLNWGESLTSPSMLRDTSASAAIAGWVMLRRSMPSCEGRDALFTASQILSKGDDLGPDVMARGIAAAGRRDGPSPSAADRSRCRWHSPQTDRAGPIPTSRDRTSGCSTELA